MSLIEAALDAVVEWIASRDPETLLKAERYDLAVFTIQFSQLNQTYRANLRERTAPYFADSHFMFSFNEEQGRGKAEKDITFLENAFTPEAFWDWVAQDIFSHDVTLNGGRVLANLHDHVLREMVTFPALYDLLRHRSALVRVPALRRVRRGLRQHNGWI